MSIAVAEILSGSVPPSASLSRRKTHASSGHMNALTTTETEALLTLGLVASLAEGGKHERQQL